MWDNFFATARNRHRALSLEIKLSHKVNMLTMKSSRGMKHRHAYGHGHVVVISANLLAKSF